MSRQEDLRKLTPIRSGEFDFQTRNKVREKFFRENPQLVGTSTEIDHVVPRYLGGDTDISNADVLSKPEHAQKHFLGAFFPEPEQNADSEWFGARQVIGRLTRMEFAQFLEEIEPTLSALKNWLSETKPPKRK